jgi:cell division protein FtsI (penicillin-binding protein 3)
MIRVTKKKKRTTKRLYGLFFLIFLSAAAGVGLYKLSPSLLDIGRNFRHAADKILEQSADIASAESVLRGTVFDRNFKELAVSYRLYSLYVRPAEITNTKDVIQIIADVTGYEENHLHARLNEAKSIINVAEHLEQSQVDMIKNARFPGLYIKPMEERFYPEHETAASLIGFTGKGIGLSGVEGVFDVLLQEGEFRADTISEIDFSEQRVLGRAKIDVVLTIDLVMQKRIERQLKGFLERNQASRGIAILMDPRSGAVLTWASQPSFNPNYYWQMSDAKNKSLFEDNLDPDLLRNLRVRVAAIQKKGDSGTFLLPETVAMNDYGLVAEEIEQFGQFMRGGLDGKCSLPSCGPLTMDIDSRRGLESTDTMSPIEWAATAASLLNGGWRVSPYVLDAVYDHRRDRIYQRPVKQDNRGRVLSPTMGIRVRHDMAVSSAGDKGKMILQADSIERIRERGGKSEYVMQEALLGAIPAKSPEMLLFIVTQRDDLYPFPRKIDSRRESIRDFGKELLASLYKDVQERSPVSQAIASRVPKSKDMANYNQFLISSRIDFQEGSGRGVGRVAVMPQLVGLSLRKGLQRLNEYQVQVKVQGSGQIVSQVPGPGEPLHGVGECVLTLDSEI